MDHVTTEAILQTAAEQFAAKGFDGARVDEIAAAAGVNKATLYYRVGDKAALYGAVLDHVLTRAADRITSAMANASSPEDKVRTYVREFAASAREQRHFGPLMMREVAGGGVHVPDSALRQMGRIVNALDQVVRAGITAGLFRNVNPFIAHMLVVGSLSFFNAGTPLRERIAASQGLDFRPATDIAPDTMTEQLAEMVLGALKNNQEFRSKKP